MLNITRQSIPSILLLSLASIARSATAWPELDSPAREIGGGANDVAVIVGIEDYAYAPRIAGAKSNAEAWYDYMTKTRGVPVESVKLLTSVDATREEILDAVSDAARKAKSKGAYWFIFIGHGAPSSDGKDGLLIGVDAQQKASSLQARAVSRSEILRVATSGKSASVNVILDACFSGRSQDGSSLAPGLQPLIAVPSAVALDPRIVMLTAARSNQFAGSLPGAPRPAFSYLVLGGLRGWAAEGKRNITATELHSYAKNALGATLRGRDQTPELVGSDRVIAISAGEAGPDLSSLVKATAGSKPELFQISNLPKIPVVAQPSGVNPNVNGDDWRDLDVAALGKYDAVIKIDKSDASVAEKIRRWRELGRTVPKYASEADARAAQWERYSEEFAKTDKLRQERIEARNSDWKKLSQLLALDIVKPEDKKRWASQFVAAYGSTSDENPYVEDLVAYLPKGAVKIIPGAKENARRHGRAGVEWITIEAGNFLMGGSNGDPDEYPIHGVGLPSFQLAKTEVTFDQYQKCVDAGVCSKLRCSSPGGDYPVNCADWDQANAFAVWVGGRLPSEAEWEFAAKGGNEKARYRDPSSCDTAVFGGSDCGITGPHPVCSHPEGNTPQGLCDMNGNVWEWMQDWYHDSYEGAPADGIAWEYPAASDRVIRGGAWDSTREAVRGSNRGNASMKSVPNLLRLIDQRINNLGFRPARSN